MPTKNILKRAALAAGLLVAMQQASAAGIYITEFAYQGGAGEFVELTNLSNTAINFSGWKFDDDSRDPAVGFDLSGFGLVASGESVIFTEATATDFRTFWGLANTVKVLGGVTNNLGRNDEINIFDGAGLLVDRLTFGDQNFPGSIRTQTSSGHVVSQSALGANAIGQWVLSTAGDIEGSVNIGGSIASPGKTSFAPAVPIPATVWLFGSALAGVCGLKRRRA